MISAVNASLIEPISMSDEMSDALKGKTVPTSA